MIVPMRSALASEIEPRVGDGLLGGHDAELAEAIPTLGFFRFDQTCRIEVLDFRRKATGMG